MDCRRSSMDWGETGWIVGGARWIRGRANQIGGMT